MKSEVLIVLLIIILILGYWFWVTNKHMFLQHPGSRRQIWEEVVAALQNMKMGQSANFQANVKGTGLMVGHATRQANNMWKAYGVYKNPKQVSIMNWPDFSTWWLEVMEISETYQANVSGKIFKF